jgi:hypothetical protein
MLDQSQIDTLKFCLTHTDNRGSLILDKNTWWLSGDNLHSVARILTLAEVLKTRCDVIDFFEAPYKWETDMQKLVNQGVN